MPDLIIAVAFVAMVATPAMVAAIGSRKEYNPGPESRALGHGTVMTVRPIAPLVHPKSKEKAAPAEHRLVTSDGPTLPMHNARGMANR
ncbi:MAG TPA: hypothetical protein VGF88_00240 [Acidobacteriaceae bacterium]|jgi:hypothetical protein